MALRLTLEADFGSGGFSLDGTLDGIGGDLLGISIPDLDLDADSIGDAAGQLEGVGVEGIAEAATAVVAAIGEVGLDLPLVDDLMGPLTSVLALGEAILSTDHGSTLDGLLGSGAGIEGGGLEVIEQRVGAVVDGLGGPGVGVLLDAVGALAPGRLDLDGMLAELGRHGLAFKQAVGAIGGLMAVESNSRALSDGVRLVEAMMGPSELAAVVARLEGAGQRSLADLLQGIDPDDPELVALVAPPILQLMAEIREAAEAMTRGLAFGQATLVGLDPAQLVARLDGASSLLVEGSLGPVREVAEAVVERFQPLLDLDLPDPADSLEGFLDLVTDHVASLATAVEQLDPARLAGGLTAGLEPVVAFVDQVEGAANEVVVAARAIFEPIRQAVEAIDLTSLIEVLTSALAPIETVVATITGLIGDAEATIAEASAAVVEAMNTVRSSVEGAVAVVGDAFARIQTALDALDLDGLQATLEAGIGPVADSLASVQVRPFFTAAGDAIETTADVVGAVPLGLLPDDAKADLAEAVAPVKAIRFQEDVADPLDDRMIEILAKLDTAVLAEIDAAYRDVIAFLDSIDPAAPLEEFEAAVYDPFLDSLRAINPEELLAPLQQAIDPIQQAIGEFSIGDELLAPIEDAIDGLQATINPYQPSQLVVPVQAEIDRVRTALIEGLRIDEIDGWLDDAEAQVASLIARIDPVRLLDALDGAWPALVKEVTGPSNGVGVGGSVVNAFVRGIAPGIRTDAFDTVSGWVGGQPAGSVVQGRLVEAAASLEALGDAVAAVDLGQLVAELSPVHRALTASIAALPEGSLLRSTIEIDVAAASPLELLGPFIEPAAGYREALATAAAELARAAGSERSLVDAMAAEFREAIRPLQTIIDWVRALIGRFGVDTAGTSFGDIVSQLLTTLTPTRVLGPAIDAITALTDRLQDLAVVGVLGPAREIVQDVRAALDAIDIGFIVAELDAVHGEIVDGLDALRPSVALGGPLVAAEALQTQLADFDPLAPVEIAITAMTTAIDEGAEALRPTVLFEPVITIYQSVVGALGALDVRAILDPLLAALGAIAVQLGDGLDTLAVSLQRLQDALPDPGSLTGGGGGSVGVSLEIG